MNYYFSVHIEKKQRVDMYLSALFTDISRSYIQKLIDTWCVKVNGSEIKKNLKLEPRDEISIEEIITSTEILPENIPLDIIFEDENICVINKDPNINVHPTPWVEGKKGTLVNALLYHCREKLPVISWEQRPGIVHRLDKDTSGVILTAKNDIYMKDIAAKIKNREVKKYYIAIVSGVLTQEKFTINSDIGRHPTDRIKMTIKNPVNPKNAVTHGEVLWYIDETYTVIKIDLETWRTHQIRVHLAGIGYPIIGDSVYGNPKVNKRAATLYQVHRQMLHALEFHIDLYEKKQCYRAELKDDMKSMIPDTIEI